MKAQISNEKITLKKYETKFAPLLYEAARESRGGEFSRWMSWCHENYTLAESEDFIEKSIENWKAKSEFDYAVFLTETNKFIGGISLNLFNWDRKLSNLGYWVRVGSQNQGIAHTAAELLVESAFQETDLNRIEIVAAVGNYASQKAAEKAGAVREGVLRQLISIGGIFHDAVVFSIIREDFKNKP